MIDQARNECESHPCQNGAACRDEVNGYHCECAPGFQGLDCSEGTLIEIIIITAHNPGAPNDLFCQISVRMANPAG